MTERVHFPASLLSAGLAGATSQGYSPQHILEKAGLPADFLDNPANHVDKETFNRFIQVTWDTLQDEASGFLTHPLLPGHFAMMCHATITCVNLRRALLRTIRYVSLQAQDFIIHLEEQGEEAILRLENTNTKGLDDHYFIITMFIVYLRWAAWLIDRPILLERIHFRSDRPAFAEQLKDGFNCRHYFNQPNNQVVFSTRFLSLPVVQTAQTLPTFLANAPACLLTHYRSDNSFTGKVQQLLQNENGVENSPLDKVASRLLTTPQTLRRRLKEEGNTFQEIKDTVRRDKAIYHLVKKDTPINELVTLMGFSEPSAFNRAFKKWTGTTPGHYRETHQSLPG